MKLRLRYIISGSESKIQDTEILTFDGKKIFHQDPLPTFTQEKNNFERNSIFQLDMVLAEKLSSVLLVQKGDANQCQFPFSSLKEEVFI